MTSREKLEDMLLKRGLSPKDAKKVVENSIPEIDSLNYGYRITWDRPYEEYPEIIYSLFFNSIVKKTALEYIKENCPQVWFRPMFE
jgi:hypothetical protein